MPPQPARVWVSENASFFAIWLVFTLIEAYQQCVDEGARVPPEAGRQPAFVDAFSVSLRKSVFSIRRFCGLSEMGNRQFCDRFFPMQSAKAKFALARTKVIRPERLM
jgi:hypothetical protein